MANTGIVGALKVLLGLDTADFDAGIKKSTSQLGSFGKAFSGAFLPAASVAGAGLALAAFTKTLFDTAGQVTDLAAQTGLTTDSIQEMQAAAALTGTSLEAFTNAAFKLGVNLATGTDKIRNAVEALGLSYETLRKASPDEQFKTIATALGELEDVQLRNKLAVDLFGKAAKEILPAIAQHYDVIADSATKAGKAQLAALDAAGDALASFWTATKTLAIQTMGDLVIHIGGGLKLLAFPIKDLFDGITSALEALGLKAAELPKVIGAARVALSLLPKPIEAITLSLEEQRRIEKELEKGAKDSIAAQIAAAEKQKEAAIARAKALRDFYNFVGLRRMEDEAAELKQIDDQQRAWRDYYNWLGERRMEDEDRTQSFRDRLASTLDLTAVMAPFKAAVREAKPAGQAIGKSFAEGFEGVVNNIGSTLARAFEGGGELIGAVQSLGAQIGQVLSETIAASVKRSLGSTVAAGIVGGLLGGALGLGIGFAATSFSNMLRLNDANNQATKSARKLELELLRQFGTFEKLEAAAQSVGMSFEVLWGKTGVLALQNLTAAAERFRKKIEELNQEKLDLEDQIADARGELDGLLRDAAQLGYIFDRQGNFVRVDFKKMQEVAEEFGVALEALGPAFHAQRLAADAKTIWEAIDLLARGGVDAGTILTGLKDEINKLVIESKKFGTTIPENMRPWIQNLIDTGQLIDEDGRKITDISEINFGPPIASEFDLIKDAIIKMIEKLDLLISRLDALITLLDNLPHPDAPWQDWPPPPKPDEGGWTPPGQPDLPPDEERPLAAGGLIRRATRAIIGEGGQPELVGPVDFMAEALARAMHSLGGFVLPDLGARMAPALAGAPPGTSGPPTIITNHFAFEVSTLDTDELSRLIRRRVIPEINAQLANVGDLRSGMRDGLGI